MGRLRYKREIVNDPDRHVQFHCRERTGKSRRQSRRGDWDGGRPLDPGITTGDSRPTKSHTSRNICLAAAAFGCAATAHAFAGIWAMTSHQRFSGSKPPDYGSGRFDFDQEFPLAETLAARPERPSKFSRLTEDWLAAQAAPRNPIKQLASAPDRTLSASRLQTPPFAGRCGCTGTSASAATGGHCDRSRSLARRGPR